MGVTVYGGYTFMGFWRLEILGFMASKLYGVNTSIIIFVFVLYCILLYCIVLYCIVLYCIVLYCIVFMMDLEIYGTFESFGFGRIKVVN